MMLMVADFKNNSLTIGFCVCVIPITAALSKGDAKQSLDREESVYLIFLKS
jgi:hypothetical protein